VFLLHDTEDWQARDAALRLKEGLQLLQKTSCCLEVPASLDLSSLHLT
jgi:hypothetical protein